MGNNPTYNLSAIPNGVAGVRATLKHMARISREYKKNPTIRELALRLTRDLPQKKWVAEIAAIHHFVQNKIRYTKDILGVETLQTPIQTLRLRAGDCDDKSMLVASLLMALGHPVRFEAFGRLPGKFQHVLPYTRVGGKWVAVETTEPWPLGKGPTGMKAKMVEHI